MINTTESIETKQCSKCGTPKRLDEFNLETNHHDGRRSECKACKLEQTNAWRDANREHVNALAAIRNKTEKNRAQHRERMRRYRQRHPEKKRAENALYRKGRKAKRQTFLT